MGRHHQSGLHQSHSAPPRQGRGPAGQVPGFPGQVIHQGAQEGGEGRRESLPQLSDMRLHSHQEPQPKWHKPGAEMLAADTLSRVAISSASAQKFAQFAQAVQEQEVQPPLAVLLPPYPF